ncbi:MAG: mannose-1-phosphate guanylyltransferase/mannose-6-phosphate isomerase [Polynucleobacter sp.]
MPKLVPVILSGGSGSRLWPVSREGHPKPFMKLADGQTLIQKTYLRAAALSIHNPALQMETMLTVTNRDYYFTSRDELAKTTAKSHFLLEPFGRNTAAAIALAAHSVRANEPDAVMLVLPADHLIQDEVAFSAALAGAVALAQSGYLVTFGVVPDKAETGFGYIQYGDPILSGFAVERFVEKPDAPTAQSYIDAGNFLWNSGMFCFKAATILEQLAVCAPEIANAAERCWIETEQANKNTDCIEILAAFFELIPSLSIDYAVMEKSKKGALIPVDIGWSDIGSWDAIAQLVKPDENNNKAIGDAIFIDSKNTFIQSEDRLVAAVGVDNLLVIETSDALLVVNANKTQEVKRVVAQLHAHGHSSAKSHSTVRRPWGTYTILEEGPGFKVKRIVVLPGASLSLQMHHHRSEHWIVVSGVAQVVNGEKKLQINANESTYIPAGHRHRLSNSTDEPLIMIEVQSGHYLGEDDIVRFDDYYGRA